MAFPTTSVLDDFNTGANQSLLAASRAGWRAATVFTTPLITDAVPTYASTATGLASGDWNSVFGADQEVWATFKATPTSTAALYARIDVTSGNGYVLTIAGGSMTINVWTGFSNAASVGSPFSVTPAIGDSFGMSCIGTTISGWYKTAAGAWTQQITGTNATYNTTGRIVVLSFGTPAIQYDAFGGGDVVAASTLRSLALTGVGA